MGTPGKSNLYFQQEVYDVFRGWAGRGAITVETTCAMWFWMQFGKRLYLKQWVREQIDLPPEKQNAEWLQRFAKAVEGEVNVQTSGRAALSGKRDQKH